MHKKRHTHKERESADELALTEQTPKPMCPLIILEMYLFFVGAPIRVVLSGSIARVLARSLVMLRVFQPYPVKEIK